MLTTEEEKKKKEIFDAMSPKRRERILKKGYNNWDPFQKPKEPLEKFQQSDLGQAREIALQFFVEKNLDNPTNPYAQGVSEICQGVLREDEKYRGMFDFCLWYQKKRGDKD